MALRIEEMESEEWREDWPLPPRPRFMESRTFGVVCRQLTRYARQEIPGRSLLIAGHRGAGKSTLIQRAVDDVDRAMIREAQLQAHELRPESPCRPQRPLLVKLHGPSLLTDRLPGVGTTVPDGGKADSKEHGALAQLMIGLYRALAREVSRGFAIHAREEHRRRPQGDHLELATQVTLELDRAPDPATLRAFWQRLGRLQTGVLWPSAVGAALGDQGMREVVAVATAAQAYQVCSGSVSDQQTGKKADSGERNLENKGEANLKDAANALVGPLAGGLVGVAAAYQFQSLLAGAAAGIGTSLVSNLTLSWSSKRSSKRESTAEYTFIRDRTIQTLDRELPLVIGRIRDAGLTPIFVIDELDKLEKCGDEVGALIHRLKHLVSDFGFFCFLTDRDYFEHLRSRLRSSAYPLEHTYFSDWLYVQYQPSDMHRYLGRILRSDQKGPQDDFRARVMSRFILHRSKLNTTDLHREIVRLCDTQGVVDLDQKGERSPLHYRIPALMQIAIEHLLESDGLRERVERDPRFAQIAADMLYKVSRAWEAGRAEVDVGRTALASYLLPRMHAGERVPDAEAEETLAPIVGRTDWDLLVEQVQALAGFLADIPTLERKILPQLRQDEQAWPRPLFAGAPRKLLEPVDGKRDVYRFVYDTFGRDVAAKAAIGDATGLPQDIAEEIRRLVGFFDVLSGTLGELDLEVQDLVSAGMLPSGMLSEGIDKAVERLRGALESDQPYEELSLDLPVLRSFAEAAKQHGLAITRSLLRALDIAHDARVSMRSALEVPFMGLSEFLYPFIVRDHPGALSPGDQPALQVDTVREWRDHVLKARETLRASGVRLNLVAEASAMWDVWARRMIVLLKSGYAFSEPQYVEIVLGAARRPPAGLFRTPLHEMSPAEWSNLAAQAFMSADDGRSSEPFPGWVLVAALHRLGFGRDVLKAAAERPHPGSPGDKDLEAKVVERLMAMAPEARRGFVLVMLDQNSLAQNPPAQTAGKATEQPLIALRADQIAAYDPFVRWLAALGAIEGVVYEEDPESL